MRRIVLPLSLLAFACQSDSTPATTDPDSSGSGDTSSSGSTEPTTTTLSTTDVDSTGPTDSSSSSSSSSSDDDDTNEETVDPDTGPTNVCGDGMITESEMCEPGDFGINTCETQGFGEGVLECSNDCLGFNTDGCFTCGNNNIEGPEDCDGPLGNNIDCESEGFTEGEITCNVDSCQYDTSQCSLCGNGVREGNESCDGDDFGKDTCASLGFDSGTLDCEEAEAECGLIVISCVGGSFTADFETGAFPEQFVLAGNEEWEVDNSVVLNGAFSAHSGNISDSENSILRLEVGFSIDGTVEFNHREDTQSFSDFLEFRIDGTVQQTWGGVTALTPASFPVVAGSHTLEWRYQKDNFNSQGGDVVYVDDIVLTNGVAL